MTSEQAAYPLPEQPNHVATYSLVDPAYRVTVVEGLNGWEFILRHISGLTLDFGAGFATEADALNQAGLAYKKADGQGESTGPALRQTLDKNKDRDDRVMLARFANELRPLTEDEIKRAIRVYVRLHMRHSEKPRPVEDNELLLWVWEAVFSWRSKSDPQEISKFITLPQDADQQTISDTSRHIGDCVEAWGARQTADTEI